MRGSTLTYDLRMEQFVQNKLSYIISGRGSHYLRSPSPIMALQDPDGVVCRYVPLIMTYLCSAASFTKTSDYFTLNCAYVEGQQLFHNIARKTLTKSKVAGYPHRVHSDRKIMKSLRQHLMFIYAQLIASVKY